MPQKRTASTFNICHRLIHVIINPAQINQVRSNATGHEVWNQTKLNTFHGFHFSPLFNTSKTDNFKTISQTVRHHILKQKANLIASSPCCTTIVVNCVKIPLSSAIVDPHCEEQLPGFVYNFPAVEPPAVTLTFPYAGKECSQQLTFVWLGKVIYKLLFNIRHNYKSKLKLLLR